MKSHDITENNETMRPSTRGYLVTLASFWVHCVVCGVIYSCGLFHEMLLDGKDTHLKVSITASLLLGMSALAGIPSMLLSYKIGCHWTVILGSSVATVGFFLSIFAEHMVEYHLTVGLMGGLGFGLTLTPSITIIEAFFHKHSETPAALATSGIQVGTLLFPPFIFLTFDHFKWNGLAVFLALSAATLIGTGLLMRPPLPLNVRKGYLMLFRKKLLKSFAFDAILVCDFLWSLGIAIIYTYLPHYLSLIKDMKAFDAAVLIAIVGLSGFLNRAIFIVFSRTARLDHCSTFLCTVVLAAIMTGLFPEMFNSKAGAIGYAIILGTHAGYWSTFVAHCTEELIGFDYVARGKGFILLAVAAGLLSGPLVGGIAIDYSSNIKIAFYLAGACLTASSVLMMSLTLGKCYYRPVQDGMESDATSNASSVIMPEGKKCLSDCEAVERK